MNSANWQFFIDVGGTFTDVVARRPDGVVVTHKLLSSGVVRGVAGARSTADRIVDPSRIGDPPDLWRGFGIRPAGHVAGGNSSSEVKVDPSRVVSFDSATGTFFLDAPLAPLSSCLDEYELRSGEEAPILAIRYLMGLGLDEAIGAVEVRLGTTRATNALLERKGARVALVTTRGFADVLKIGYQDRPRLFDLHIKKRDELAAEVIEIDERLDASGSALRLPDKNEVHRLLEAARGRGIDALAICLLHSFRNPDHEDLVASVADGLGFRHISVSSRIARIERIVPRGDTTVADAYLSPVIQEYVASLRRSMPEARLSLMASHGGLSGADAVSGKDTILSGPAGGVVGCRYVASGAGISKTIGFDMGGTSTDVSRIDDGPNGLEYQHETVKAGVRIVTPMLAVETVAAGGGSICSFDGQKLVVGPQSAGADPGPASYGRGGPLTVTDMNVFLGRVVAEYFPFPLDRHVVQEKLDALCSEIGESTGSAIGSIELAEGFVSIANANMAGAIKRISITKGYDVREYALTTFGGAGAQHACAVASELGITRILCNRFAGVLSAVGIGVADVKRIGQRSVDAPLCDGSRPRLTELFELVGEEPRQALMAEGVDTATLESPVFTMDCCYVGQSTLITIPAEPTERAGERFEAAHRRLYGYVHEGRAVVVRVVRVELSARSSVSLSSVAVGKADGIAADERTTSMVVDGKRRAVPVYLRCELPSQWCASGPAIVIEDTSTIVIDAGWEGRLIQTGDLELVDVQSAAKHIEVSTDVDPVYLELFNNQFSAIAEQMGATLRRTALSVNVKERLDFSCAVFAPDGGLVVNAPHIPVHLGSMSHCVRALTEDVGRFEPGDVFVTNDPYRGGSHLNDVTVITPVHDDGGRKIVFFVASRAHHAEIGGTRPGSMPPDSTSLAQEGVVVRAFRWIRDGKPQLDALRALLTESPYPSRTPEDNLADIAAQVAANQTGVRELQELIGRFGIDVVHSYMGHIQVAAERKMRDALSRLPDGVRTFEDRLDDGSPIKLAFRIEGDHAVLDFSGSAGVHRGNLNANPAIVTSAVLYCLRCLIDEEIPLNSGVLAPIDIVLPEGMLNPPSARDPNNCPAVVGGNVETSQRIVDCVLGALGLVAASQGTMNNLLMGNEQFGYYETICGGSGAGPGGNGADAVHTHMTNTRLTDPETLESCVPVRLIRFEIRRGSGGGGKYRGGCGVVREMEFLAGLDVSIISQRRTTSPYGLAGGSCGAPGRNLLFRAGADGQELLESIAQVSVKSGDRLTIETPGGGGWGEE